MERNMSSKYWVFLLLPFLWSCVAKKQLREVKQKDVAKEIEASTEDLKNNQLNYQTFTAKAKANLNLEGKGYDVSLNIRNKKGEVIWVSVTYVAGLEVARLMITPDSVSVLNRMNSEYAIYPFNFIHRYTSSQIDYKALEAMIVGNTLDLVINTTPVIESINGLLSYKGIAGDLMFESLYSALFKPQRLILEKANPLQSLNVDYERYALTDGRLVPFKIGISSAIDNRIVKIDLEYLTPQFDVPLEFPFSVPKRFTRIE